MLLRFAALYGVPATPGEWAVYHTWRKGQEGLPECRMAEADPAPDGLVCKDCAGRPDCPKERRRT